MRQEKIECSNCQSRGHSLFHYCGPAELDVLDAHKSSNVYKKGQILFFEGNNPLGLFCINHGLFKVYKTGLDGKEQILYLAKPGDFMGYRALIAEEPYTASAEALDESVACFIPKADFTRVLEQQPDISRKLMRSLCHELGIAAEKLTSMAQKTVRERLAETLLLLYESFEHQNNDTISIQLPREDIANITGTSTETVIRLLSEFKEDGMIELKGRNIRVANPSALKKAARLS